MSRIQHQTSYESQWRRRNPDAAARLDKLPAAARDNIRTVFQTAGASRGIKPVIAAAESARKEATRERNAAAYRARVERAKGKGLSPAAARGHARTDELTVTKANRLRTQAEVIHAAPSPVKLREFSKEWEKLTKKQRSQLAQSLLGVDGTEHDLWSWIAGSA